MYGLYAAAVVSVLVAAERYISLMKTNAEVQRYRSQLRVYQDGPTGRRE